MRPVNQKHPRGGRPGGGGGGVHRRPHQTGGHRNFDSNGPDVKIRGTASQIFDRYCQLARDANAVGDRIAAENYLQHAEHYFRTILANGLAQQPQRPAGQPQSHPSQGNGGQQPYVEAEPAAPSEGDSDRVAPPEEAPI